MQSGCKAGAAALLRSFARFRNAARSLSDHLKSRFTRKSRTANGRVVDASTLRNAGQGKCQCSHHGLKHFFTAEQAVRAGCRAGGALTPLRRCDLGTARAGGADRQVEAASQSPHHSRAGAGGGFEARFGKPALLPSAGARRAGGGGAAQGGGEPDCVHRR